MHRLHRIPVSGIPPPPKERRSPAALLWNPIEHRLFSEISKTWAGCPLRWFDLLLHYINDTRTATGLQVQAHLVSTKYETGLKVSDDQMAALALQAHEVCPQWNYTIHPRPNRLSTHKGGDVIHL